MTATKEYPWKILALGREQRAADKANKYLHEIGFKNALVVALANNHASDEKLIELLKWQEWDGISIGGGINGYDENFEKQPETLYWFNRLVNIIHEHAPKAKFIFVQNIADMASSFERVLGGQS